MGHFWASFFDHLRNCGRNATLFMITLGLLLVLIILGVLAYVTHALPYVLGALVGAMLIAMAVAFRRMRARRRMRGEYPPLSALELRNARARLRKARS